MEQPHARRYRSDSRLALQSAKDKSEGLLRLEMEILPGLKPGFAGFSYDTARHAWRVSRTVWPDRFGTGSLRKPNPAQIAPKRCSKHGAYILPRHAYIVVVDECHLVSIKRRYPDAEMDFKNIKKQFGKKKQFYRSAQFLFMASVRRVRGRFLEELVVRIFSCLDLQTSNFEFLRHPIGHCRFRYHPTTTYDDRFEGSVPSVAPLGRALVAQQLRKLVELTDFFGRTEGGH